MKTEKLREKLLSCIYEAHQFNKCHIKNTITQLEASPPIAQQTAEGLKDQFQ
jgi:hypothetical protein